MRDRRFAARALLIMALVVVTAAPASPTTHVDDGQFVIAVVTFRGCEEACNGFLDYVAASDLDAQVVVKDIARDRRLLPGLVDEVQAMAPDLLVTWGTTVTLGMLGTVDDHEGKISGIPAVFMIVADPAGAGIVESDERSGRPLVTGTRNRVPEETQMRVLGDYREFDRIGLVYNTDEVNAVLKADEIKKVGADLGFEVVERVLAAGSDGLPLVDDIPIAVADIAQQDVDFLYVGSSSFLLANADLFTRSALDHGLAVATAYEAMVQDSHGLIAVASAYYNVGQLAGFQAEQILGGAVPGELEILGLDRFTVLVNIETAHRLRLYPPMLLLRYAEIVGDGTG